jgi:uncharacterized protein YfiM (DUF2279 family)
MKSREEYIDKLAAKADAKAEYEKQIRQMKDKRDTATQKLQELKGASSDAWDTLKAGSEAAWADLKSAVTTAKEKFKK